MRHAAARRLADAMRLAAERSHERRGRAASRATVLGTDPLLLDLHGSDLELGPDDVTIGKTVRVAGFDTGDALILVEVEEGEWIAVDGE